MSLQQCAAAAVQVFPTTPIHTRSGVYSLRVVMVAIAKPQSSWNPRAAGDCGLSGPSCGSCALGGSGATSWGLWQIHNSTGAYLVTQTHSTNACDWATWLFDPVNNAKAAYYLYRKQGLTRAWGGAARVWDTDAVQAAIPDAVAAVKAAQTAPQKTSTTTPSSVSVPVTAVIAHPAVVVGAVLAVGGLTVAGIEVVQHRRQRREWCGRQVNHDTVSTKEDSNYAMD